MAKTVQLQIAQAVLALLNAGTPLAGGRIDLNRRQSMPEQDPSRIFVYWDTSFIQRAQLSGMPDDWMTRVRIECAARSTTGVGAVSADEVANDLAQAVYARLTDGPDALGLGGLCMDGIAQGLASDTEEAETQVAVVQVVFDYKHRTPANSITAA